MTIKILTTKSPAAHCSHGKPVPAKAKPKNKRESAIDEGVEEAIGGNHHARLSRRRLKIKTSKPCAKTNAAPDDKAIRAATAAPAPSIYPAINDNGTPKAKPKATTFLAAAAPAMRLTQSVTKNASGKVNAAQVSQSGNQVKGKRTR